MEWMTVIVDVFTVKSELVLAYGSGIIGAIVAMVKNKRKETFLEAILNVIVGMIVAAGVTSKFGESAPAVVCMIGLFAGAAGALAFDTVIRLAPTAVWSIIAGNVERFGGKPMESEKEEDK